MSERYLPLKRLDRNAVKDPWVLVLGGVTNEGNRRARRVTRAAAAAQYNVVWVDGFEETYGDPPHEKRSPVAAEAGPEVVIVGYADLDRGLLTNRMSQGSPDAAAGRLAMLLRKKVLRRVAVALRGYLGWRLVRKNLKEAVSVGPPAQIIYADDYALTQAWHVSRMWPDVRVAMEFEAR